MEDIYKNLKKAENRVEEFHPIWLGVIYPLNKPCITLNSIQIMKAISEALMVYLQG